MAEYTNNLRLKEIATGDESGQWGTSTNTNLELIGQALGYGTRAIANASTDNITIADGLSDSDRAIYLKLTGGGQACEVTLLPTSVSKMWIMDNGTSHALTFKQGSSSASDKVIVPAGHVKIIATDGGGGSGVVHDVLTDLNLAGTTTVDDLTVSDDLTVGDDLLLNTDSCIVKFGQDADTTLTHTDGTGLTLNGTNKLTFGDVASFVHQSSDGVLTVAGEATIALSATTAVTVSHDLKLNTDGAILGFGVDNDATLTHVDDGGLILGGTTPTLTIGDAGAEDTKIVFDGNAQDFHIGLDDSEDDLVIGKGSALGTTPALSIDENLLVTVEDDILVTDRAYGGALEAENDGSFDLSKGNDFSCTTTGTTAITFTNAKAGQSGNIKFVNGGSHTISADTMVAINADVLSTLATTGTYHLAYFCTADSGANTILVSASSILT